MVSAILITYYAVPTLSEILAPHPWSLYPPPSKYVVIEIYFNEPERAQSSYKYIGAVNTRRFEVRIESFSKELTLVRGDEIINAPYSYVETYRKPEGRPCYFGFRIIAPSKPGKYEINLRFIISNNWLSTREYPQKIKVVVRPMPHKPMPEDVLRIDLDKYVYRCGEVMNITIRNISDETLWFTNSVYNLAFERFDKNYNDWIFHSAPRAEEIITSIYPGDTVQLTLTLSADEFPPGHYRIGTHGVYVEFDVK